MKYSKEELITILNNLSKNEKILLDNISIITHIFENLKFLYSLNLKYKIKKEELVKMKNCYDLIKNNKMSDYKKIINKLGYSDKKLIILKEAIDFIKSN
ncbi:MAG: hypothetical protein PHT91_01075 [Candidatus Nanoarchaeia archaeon]|nr:hypothetical protein [Candidatus Nanoarchaeia archaeon]